MSYDTLLIIPVYQVLFLWAAFTFIKSDALAKYLVGIRNFIFCVLAPVFQTIMSSIEKSIW